MFSCPIYQKNILITLIKIRNHMHQNLWGNHIQTQTNTIMSRKFQYHTLSPFWVKMGTIFCKTNILCHTPCTSGPSIKKKKKTTAVIGIVTYYFSGPSSGPCSTLSFSGLPICHGQTFWVWFLCFPQSAAMQCGMGQLGVLANSFLL